MKNVPVRLCVGFLAWAGLLALSHALCAAELGRGDLVVALDEAVWHTGHADQKRPLQLRVERDASAWRPVVIGQARQHNKADSYGKLVEAVEADGGLRLAVRMRVEPDPWIGGEGLGVYRLQLRPKAGGWEGAWEGQFRGEAVKGAATAQFVASPIADFTPPAPGEHPRLLLRKGDLPRLREKAQTDWGRKALERLKVEDASKSSMAAGRALLYALTGDLEYAREAQRLIQADLDAGKWFETGAVHDPAAKATEGLIAYDLIYETCDAAFHAQMRELLSEQAPFFHRGADCPLFNDNDGSNWSAMYNSGAGMVALFQAGEAPPPFARPPEPQIPAVRPPADLKVAPGVPLVKMVPGKHWTEWLWVGPFHAGKGLDALEALGGAARARPENGTRVSWRACSPYATAPDPNGAVEERRFEPLDPKFLVPKAHAASYSRIAVEGGVDFAAATKQAGLTTSYVYAVMDVNQPGVYRVDLGRWKLLDVCVYVAGQRLQHGALVRLEAGRYPVLGSARMAHVNTWTKISYHVRFHRVNEDDANLWLKRQKDAWAADVEDWATDPYAARWLGVARQKIIGWTYDALGDWGWNTEGEAYTQHSYRLVLPFAHCFRTAMGKELSPHSGLRLTQALYTARTIFGDDGARMTAFGPGGGPLGVDNFARGYGLTAAKYRRAALWAWDRTQALADAGKLKGPENPADKLDPLSAAFFFVNYPLDIQPQNPSEVLPAVTVEPRRGGYVFRNRWRDANDFVTTVFLDQNFRGGGWNSQEAGDLRLQGLGVDWTVRGMGWGHTGSNRKVPAAREAQTVVLPSEPGEGGREAAATFFAAQPDGSGVLSFDLSDLYSGRKPGPKGEVKAAPSRPGAQIGYDLGLRGARAVAVDYSGVCGAPALIVVSDQLTGAAGKNTWQLVTSKENQVTVAGNRFTIRAGNGATLEATVVAPAGAEASTVQKTFSHEINYHGHHENGNFTRTVVNVPGGDFFLVALTIQPGAAPPVKVDGQGRDAKLTIGPRKVRFDGTKLVLE